MEQKKDELKNFFIQIGKEVSDPDEVGRSIPIFINNNSEINSLIYEIAIVYLSMRRAYDNKNDKEYKIFSKRYEELKKANFSDFQEHELSLYLTLYTQFIARYTNKAFKTSSKDELDSVPGLTNRFEVNLPTGTEMRSIINSSRPSVKEGMSKRDKMRRRHRGGVQNHPDTISVTLINSYIHVRIERPTRIQLIGLINNIEKELRHYGERWAINSINLERAGISRIIVDFFIGLIAYHSVQDVMDPEELKSVMLANDIDTIAITLLEAGFPSGVYYNMTCLANKCNHSEVKLYDPHDLYVELTADLDDDQLDFINKAKNSGKKSTIEEIRKYQNRYKWKGKPIETAQKLYSTVDEDEKGSPYGEMNVGVPTMTEYFNTFDMMTERYNPTIQRYAIDYPDVKVYRKKRAEFLGGVRMGEYVHWISNYITYKDPDVEESEDIVDAREDDQRGFEEGLLDIFADDDIAYWTMFSKIMETVPFMTHTLVGFGNSQCSACGGVGGKERDSNDELIETHVMVKSSGFTPIDPVLNFFDLTRMKIEEMGEIQRLQEENIS